MLNYTRQPPDASWRIVPAPRAGFQSQLISRTTPIFSSPNPAEFQSQAPPHAILKAEGNTNVLRSQHAVSPRQPDQPQMERQYRLATDDFDKLKSPPSKSCETQFQPHPEQKETTCPLAKRTQFAPGPPYLALT